MHQVLKNTLHYTSKTSKAQTWPKTPLGKFSLYWKVIHSYIAEIGGGKGSLIEEGVTKPEQKYVWKGYQLTIPFRFFCTQFNESTIRDIGILLVYYVLSFLLSVIFYIIAGKYIDLSEFLTSFLEIKVKSCGEISQIKLFNPLKL